MHKPANTFSKYYDLTIFAWQALSGYPSRTILMLLAMTIGVAAVVILTSLGEGARGYVKNEFSSLGTNLVIVLPGRNETTGAGAGNIMGATPRDLTLQDAQALLKHTAVERIAPLNVGSAEAAWENRKREVTVLGSNHQLLAIRHWELKQGRFLPDMDLERATPVCVIGSKIRDELFASKPALGEWLQLGDRRYRVIGILGSEGRSIGIDVEELVIIPVASAQALFNVPSLFRILVEVRSADSINSVIDFVQHTIKERHQGEEDVTVVTQDAVLATFDNIFTALTFAVGGIAGISLAVAGILIMNVMLVAVSQRTAEIGLLKALGASSSQVLAAFLIEAILLSLIGALLGLLLGFAGSWGIRLTFPDLPAYPPLWSISASIITALLSGSIFSLLPARKAAQLDPVIALSRR